MPNSSATPTTFWLTAASLAMLSVGWCFSSPNPSSSFRRHCTLPSLASYTNCQEAESNNEDPDGVSSIIKNITPPFPENALTYDHYNGVSLDLDRLPVPGATPTSFSNDLKAALKLWKVEGRKGIWIRASASKADLVPHCIALGFQFHLVKDQILVLSQWLPKDSISRLPHGPTHQIGVGALLLNPLDPSKILVVQEKTGPAAAYNLWKLPTGLLDPGEDIPAAASRELLEETGLRAFMEGIVCFRQAHSSNRASDLFFVCHMRLDNEDHLDQTSWTIQEEEIADIQWMCVEDYCAQQRWQGSPLYEAINDSIRKISRLEGERRERQQQEKEPPRTTTANNHVGAGLILHEQLPLGFGLSADNTNALFRSQL